MKVMFDTNVILDVLLERLPFAEPAAILLAQAERGQIQGFACATSITTIFYLARKSLGRADARLQVEDLFSILDIAPVTRAVLERAARSEIDDFEDAVIAESARQVNAQVILTRNEKDFARSPIPVHSPTSLPALLGRSAQSSGGDHRFHGE